MVEGPETAARVAQTSESESGCDDFFVVIMGPIDTIACGLYAPAGDDPPRVK